MTPLHQVALSICTTNLVPASVYSHAWHSLHHTKNPWAANSEPAPWFKAWGNTRLLRDNTSLPDDTPKYHSNLLCPELLHRLTTDLSHQY